MTDADDASQRDTAYEVEVKVRADHEAVRERLADLDADAVDSLRQEDTYYDAPDREFAETDEALRIRRETVLGDGDGGPPGNGDGEPLENGDGGSSENDDETAKLTYKGPLVEAESKTREEHETAVADDTELAAILDGLRYEPAATVEKHRDRFALDGYTITLDTVSGVGEFVEVERETDEASVERVREGAHDLLRRLDLDPGEQIRTSYLGLLLADEAE